MDDSPIDLRVTSLAYGGDAIGRIPDETRGERVVFVPFALPGERVRARPVEQRRGFVRAQLIEVLEPAPERITPRCKHFGTCGGCHYQHMGYVQQLLAKTEILRDQFRRIGHIEQPPIQPAVASPQEWYYRNQVQFHLTRDGRVGYVAAAVPLPHPNPGINRSGALPILPITECHLPEPALNELWPQLEFEAGLDIDRVVIREGAGEDLLVALESEAEELPELELEASVSVVHILEEHTAVLAGSAYLRMRVLDRDFRVSAPSFFQVNTPVAERMVQHVLEQVQARQPYKRPATIIDVYCGTGLFSAFLAGRCERLIGIESSAAACEDFSVNLDAFDNVELYEDAAENVLPSLDLQPGLMLVDPPRAGLMPQVVEALVRMSPATIGYISCDPSTLARDAARLLRAGYRLESVTPFDLFPQTFHIESISWFAR